LILIWGGGFFFVFLIDTTGSEVLEPYPDRVLNLRHMAPNALLHVPSVFSRQEEEEEHQGANVQEVNQIHKAGKVKHARFNPMKDPRPNRQRHIPEKVEESRHRQVRLALPRRTVCLPIGDDDQNQNHNRKALEEKRDHKNNVGCLEG
jgi:hypothetical protein